MIRIDTPETIADSQELSSAIGEYLAYVLGVFVDAGGPGFEIDTLTGHTLDNIAAYLPPNGQTFLARDEGDALVGMVFLKMIRPDCAEIKRLFVRPSARGRGLGRQLTVTAMETAQRLGARAMVLDTLAVMTDAQKLYVGLGFGYVDPYPETEIAPEHRPWAVFMRREF